MEKFWILIIAAFFLASCNSNQTCESKNTDSTANLKSIQKNSGNEIIKPVALSEDDFAVKVFDFRSKKNWKYIGDKPCIVDFYADWCAPCRSIAPTLKEIAKEYGGKIYVYKVNTDYARNLSGYFKINSIPAVMFCPLQGEYQMVIGANPKEYYVSLIESILKVKR
jgi:thioredoxin 1